MKTCGGCRHGWQDGEVLRCHGAPPKVIVLPAEPENELGQRFLTIYPEVPPDVPELTCAAFQRRGWLFGLLRWLRDRGP